MGITWDDDELQNEIYDRGVNLGQRIGALATALRKAGKAFGDHILPQGLD